MTKLMTLPRTTRPEPLAALPSALNPTDLIRERLLAAIGEPPDLLRVIVKPLWGCYYRANVFVGKSFDARMAHSFFLEVEDGQIVSGTPAIRRMY